MALDHAHESRSLACTAHISGSGRGPVPIRSITRGRRRGHCTLSIACFAHLAVSIVHARAGPGPPSLSTTGARNPKARASWNTWFAVVHPSVLLLVVSSLQTRGDVRTPLHPLYYY